GAAESINAQRSSARARQHHVALRGRTYIVKGITSHERETWLVADLEQIHALGTDHQHRIHHVLEAAVGSAERDRVADRDLLEAAEERVAVTGERDVAGLARISGAGHVSHAAAQGLALGSLDDDRGEVGALDLDPAHQAGELRFGAGRLTVGVRADDRKRVETLAHPMLEHARVELRADPQQAKHDADRDHDAAENDVALLCHRDPGSPHPARDSAGRGARVEIRTSCDDATSTARSPTRRGSTRRSAATGSPSSACSYPSRWSWRPRWVWIAPGSCCSAWPDRWAWRAAEP